MRSDDPNSDDSQAADSTLEGAWRVLGMTPVYESPWITLSQADVVLPSGERNRKHHVVAMPAAAIAVVVSDDGTDVLLSWRHRFVSDVWNWELPGGLVDEGETPEETVAREIVEETGYRVRTLRHLVVFEPMIGMVTCPHHVFLASGVERVADPSELNEGRFRWLPLASVPDLITEGAVLNSGTLVGLLHYLALSGQQERS